MKIHFLTRKSKEIVLCGRWPGWWETVNYSRDKDKVTCQVCLRKLLSGQKLVIKYLEE